jgi:hypothetical protein
MILCQLDLRFNPELGLSAAAMNVHMHAAFLTRKEKETKPFARNTVGLMFRRCKFLDTAI